MAVLSYCSPAAGGVTIHNQIGIFKISHRTLADTALMVSMFEISCRLLLIRANSLPLSAVFQMQDLNSPYLVIVKKC